MKTTEYRIVITEINENHFEGHIMLDGELLIDQSVLIQTMIKTKKWSDALEGCAQCLVSIAKKDRSCGF